MFPFEEGVQQVTDIKSEAYLDEVKPMWRVG